MIQSINSGNSTPRFNFQDHQIRRPRRAEASVTHLESKTSSSGSLDVTTAEGDKVSISFSAVQQLKANQAQVKTGRGKASAQDVTQSSQVQVAVKVEGSLNDQELGDIAKLLQSLAGVANAQGQSSASAVPQLSTGSQASASPVPASQSAPEPPASAVPAPSSNFGSLTSFNFQYKAQTEFQYSTHSYLA